MLYIVTLFFSFDVEALSYKSTISSNNAYHAYVISQENQQLKIKLKKENFSEDESSLFLSLRRPNISKNVVSLQTFTQELIKLNFNESQMNLAIQILYEGELEKLSFDYFLNKYKVENQAIDNLTSGEKEVKKNEYKADLLLLKYLSLQMKDENHEVQALLLRINNLINAL